MVKKIGDMVLTINGNNEIILDELDFSYIIEKYLGAECRDYFNNILQNRDFSIEDLENKIHCLEVELENAEYA